MGKYVDSGDRVEQKKRTPVWRTFKNVVILLVIFWLGVSFGNGTIQFSHSVEANKSLPNDLDYTSVEKVYDELKDKYDGKLTVQQLTDGLKSGLVSATGDPYTEYFSAKDAKNFDQQLQGTSFSGIGAQLGKDSNGNIVVESPLAGYPAEKAGLKGKDIIVKIDSKSTAGMSTDAAVKQIRGKVGTKVSLEILRGGNEYKNFTITRQNIKVPNVKSEILDGNIGYLQIVQFSTDDDFVSQVRAAAQKFKDSGVTGVVLDLRGNPGGSLPAAVDIASIWLPEGKTVLSEKRDGRLEQTYRANGNTILSGTPTVVLIDEGSASASEIVAGALKDNGVAMLMGTKSYGKGSVQEVLGFNDGSEMKVTVARWFRPSGQNIDKKGIKPDQEVKLTEEQFQAGQDPQKDAAVQKLLSR